MTNQHDLTKGSIQQHIIRIAVPAMMGSFFMTMYNVIDTMWAGKVGLDFSEITSFSEFFIATGDIKALSGISVIFPIYLIMLALTVGVQNGAMALIGNALGSKDTHLATMYLVQSFIFAAFSSIVMLLLIPLLPFLLHMIGIMDEVVRTYGKNYMTTMLIGGLFFSLGAVCNAGLVARGDTKTIRNLSILAFCLNIFLDPLLMFGIGPFPALGLNGIALATVFVQLINFILSLRKLMSYNAFCGIKYIDFLPHKLILLQILKQSVPPALNLAAISLAMGVFNRFIIDISQANAIGDATMITAAGVAGVAAYGVSLRIEQIALIPGLGIQSALSSIASQNNGAMQIQRMRQGFRTALLGSFFVWLCISIPITWIIPRYILRLFTQDTLTIHIALSYLLVCGFTFYAYMILNSCGAIFMALKKPQFLTILTILRNLGFPLITVPLFSFGFKWGLNGIWYAICFNNWVAACIAIILYIILMKKREKEVLQSQS